MSSVLYFDGSVCDLLAGISNAVAHKPQSVKLSVRRLLGFLLCEQGVRHAYVPPADLPAALDCSSRAAAVRCRFGEKGFTWIRLSRGVQLKSKDFLALVPNTSRSRDLRTERTRFYQVNSLKV